MALIKCKECGQKISNKAKKCPHCGEVISTHTKWEEEDSCGGFYGDFLEDNGILDEIASDIKFID